VAVVAIEARRPGRAVELVLADPLQAVCVGPRDRAVHRFIQHLRQARGVECVYEIFCCRPADGLVPRLPSPLQTLSFRGPAPVIYVGLLFHPYSVFSSLVALR